MKRLTKKILYLINLIAALALCGAYLANVVDPSKIWQFAFLGLAYPYLLVLNCGFFLFWWWRKKRFALLSLFCIILGFGNVGRYIQFGGSGQAVNPDSTIKVITYNVRVFNHFEWEKGISIRDSILDFLHNHEAGLICMQEFLTRSDRPKQSEASLKRKLSNTPYSHINYTYKSNGGATKFGLATFSKYPIARKGVIMFENSPNACIYSDIVKGSDTIRVYNIHLQSIKLNKRDYNVLDSLFSFNSEGLDEVKEISESLKEAFIKRSEQVRTIVKHMDDSPYPIILCGDFNDTPVSYSYHKLLGDNKDAFREAGSGVSSTYRGKLPSYRIDYVFCSNPITPISYSTGNKGLSDHYPVVTELEITRE